VVNEPADLSLTEILRLLRARRLSAVELVESCLRRIDLAEPAVLAFVTRTPERALRAARRADAGRAAGRDVGALAGVPVAVKDVFLTRGVRTSAGSRVLAEHVPSSDAALWQRFSRVGAGLMGKTTTHEFGYGTASPPTANPWDTDRTPGGSSGGSAAALAARMVPIATGTDTAGSLRIPAAACGVCTLRPARGRVSRHGVIPLSPSLDTVGPMARRMLDIALLMRLLAGFDIRDPGSTLSPRPRYPVGVPADLRGLRIGLPVSLSWAGVDEEAAAICQQALGALVARGATLVTIDPLTLDESLGKDLADIFDTINQAEALYVHRHWLARADLYTPQVRQRLLMGHRVTSSQYHEAVLRRLEWEHRWREFLIGHALAAVAHPTIDAPPPLVLLGKAPEGPGIALSLPWSLAGFPALNVPAGLDSHGLPVGISLAALPECEADLVGLGIVIDEEIGMWRRPPPLVATSVPDDDA
jgi:aspartyl-tRNA(Asn)/glutamyl-tRNA(Gln) amidotransferase subunit A